MKTFATFPLQLFALFQACAAKDDQLTYNYCYIPSAPKGAQSLIRLTDTPKSRDLTKDYYVQTTEGRWTCGGQPRDANKLCYLNGSTDSAQTCPAPQAMVAYTVASCTSGHGQCPA